MCEKSIYMTCFGLLLGLILISTANAQDPDLLGWWKLDEKSGLIAYDSSGNSNDGELIQTDGNPISNPQWVYGYAGGALWLDGVDDFVEVPHNESLQPDGDIITLMAWINIPRHTGAEASSWSGYQAIITKGNDPRMYSLYTCLDDNDRGVLHFSLGDPFVQSTSVGSVPLNEWVHVCATVIEDGGHLYYINGEPSQPAAAVTGTVIPSGTETLRIGNAPENNSLMGKIDDVRVYQRSLTQEEIQQIMISGLSSAATLPNPDNEAQEVTRDTIISWKEGQYVDTHNVYFSTDFNDVNEASVSDPRGVLVSENQSGTTFEPLGADLLEYNTTYYWRVDEINDLDPNSPWRGDVWSFTTVNFVVVDDFEDYDDANNIIYDTWLDYVGNNTGMTVGYIETVSMEKDITHTGLQSMPLQYDNDGTINEGTDLEKTGTLYYSEAECQLTDEPQDWTKEDVESLTIWFRGNPPKLSSFVEEPGGIYKIKGIGSDIYGKYDEFNFVYKEHTGAVKIIARIDSLEESADPFAKAGIMIRDTLDANARYAALLMTPENGVRYQYRSITNDSTERQFDPNVSVPYWVKFERTSGGLLRSYYSENGVDWTSFTLRQVSMANPIYIGLAVTSHDPLAACEAQFSNVSFPNTTVSDGWTSVDIGLTTNDSESMYVAINNCTPIYYDDPNASLITQWTEWNIPLQSLVDLGVDLTNVNSMSIGLGDINNSQPGGKGIMYIDDIRLYRP